MAQSAPATPITIARSREPIRRRAEEKVSALSYLLQGAGFIGFLLVLFVLAGFRG
ncbi:hypothetical protein JMJ55_13660 [Belnapia sp. T6]|uniref:Uncharacterized protein n=1 Tax=Belnapia mucosa TaxID=2804532 RepID=A0ABS1V3V7_9PROT|nr:hypothetical protein [Belnapia mucosa]MBL6456375.1 hypothetical protein [Belnapia mucosa]